MNKPDNTFYATHEIKFNLKGKIKILFGGRAIIDTETCINSKGDVLYAKATTNVEFKGKES